MEWISVEAKLPNIDTEVLVVYEGNDGNKTITIGGTLSDWYGAWFYANEHGHCMTGGGILLSKGRITHWMPLPALPSGL